MQVRRPEPNENLFVKADERIDSGVFMDWLGYDDGSNLRFIEGLWSNANKQQ